MKVRILIHLRLFFCIIFIIIIPSNIMTNSRIAEVVRKCNECIHSYCLLSISSLVFHIQFAVLVRKLKNWEID